MGSAFRLATLCVVVAGCGGPEHGTRGSALEGAATMKLVTLNVLQTESVGGEARTRGVVRWLERSGADVIVLQEVEPYLLDALLDARWVRQRGYDLSRVGGEPGIVEGQLVLSRFPLVSSAPLHFSAGDGASASVTRLCANGRLVALADVHLTSGLDEGDARAVQLGEAYAAVEDADDAFVVGDTNFGDGAQPETSALRDDYLDVFRALNPSDPGFTWDLARNPLAALRSWPEEQSRRLDKIYVRSRAWAPRSAELFADRWTPGVYTGFVSDHFGVEATFTFTADGSPGRCDVIEAALRPPGVGGLAP